MLNPIPANAREMSGTRGQAEHSREAVFAPLSGSRRLRRETLNDVAFRGRSIAKLKNSINMT